MNLLHLDSSITGEASVTRRLSAAIVARLHEFFPDLRVVRRDLAADPLPYFSAETLGTIAGSAGEQPLDHHAEGRLDRLVLDEFMRADIVVIGAPMYNFTVPAQLKTWIDYLAIAGVTFRYTAQGPEGLAVGKRVFIASSRGGFYGPGAPGAPNEHQTSYLRAALGFLGVTDVEVIEAEGLKMSPEHAQEAVAAALASIAALETPVLRSAA